MKPCLRFLAASILLLCCFAPLTFAQTLEEVSFGPGTNTHLTGINNAGFICGWYDSAGATMGFVINPNGKIIRANYTTSFSTKFMKINDHNTILVNKTTGSTIDVYKAYYDSVTESFPNGFVAMSNNQQPGIAQPFGLNNKNDFSGWYQGATYRFLWVNHDSIGGPPQWVFDKQLTYNTMGTAINDNNIATGFYINGSSYGPFLYDVATNTFTILNTAFHMQPYGINNSNVICGQYWATSGYLTAFWGPVNGAGVVTTHNMSTLWQNPLTQSVANGINDKTEIVGEYLHPTSSLWTGFIYRPNTNEYRLPGYDFTTMSWGLRNTTAFPANATDVWTPNYTANLNYTQLDPFAGAGYGPTIDPFLLSSLGGAFCNQPNLKNMCADWRSFARESDNFGVLSSVVFNYPVWKHTQFTKLVSTAAYGPGFSGICYGFAFTSLMKYVHDSTLANRFNIPLRTNLYNVPNTDTNAITAITRAYLKQYDNATMVPYTIPYRKLMNPWAGLYRLKNCYLDANANHRNPRAVYISLKKPNNKFDWHEVLPYKIRTPKMFPFNNAGNISRDTMWVYDSNRPKDSTQYFLINTTGLQIPNDSAINTTYPSLGELCFNEAGIREILKVQHSALKGTAASPPDTILRFALTANHYYTITGTGSTQAVYNASTSGNSIPYLQDVYQKDTGIDRPRFFNIDTTHSVAVNSYNYIDTTMMWSISDPHHIMGITRPAKTTESDNGTWKGRSMSYGTHDAATKELSGYLMQTDDDPTKGVNILVSNITMNNGDSILTINPAPFIYKIIRFGTTTDKYDLWVYQAGADSLRQFRMTDIPMAGGTSHTVVPYSGPGGKTVIIQVDAGNNGTVDSTITVPTYTVGIHDARLPEGYVSIYPNPAGKSVTIAWKADIPQGSLIFLNDIAGRTILSRPVATGSRNMNLSIGELPAGTYLIRLMTDMGELLYSDKLVKE